MPRLKGSTNKTYKDAVRRARKIGILPHEWLLKIVHGEPIEQKKYDVKFDAEGNEISRKLITIMIYPDFPTRVDVAKSCSAYFAPRLASQAINTQGGGEKIAEALKELGEKLPV